ncbi:MAG TPA: phosphatase PAP2 family protein [Bacteroidia bacterium]|nr:phosphatase PAP2 family protein [Bacteroidia bacterium]
MLRSLANIISILISPLFAPTYLFFIILFFFPGWASIDTVPDKILAIVYIFLATFGFSFLLIWILFKMGKIEDITMNKQKDRYLPQIFLSVIYVLITGYLFNRFGKKDALALGMLGSAITVVVITVVNRFWKISTHSSGVAGVFGIVTALFLKATDSTFLMPYLVIAFLTLTVCAARLYLKAHTPLQVICGFILGGTSGFCLFWFR